MRTAAEDEQVIPVEKQAAGPMGSGSGSSGARLESGRAVCGGAAEVSGSFGIQGAAGSCRVRPGSGGSGERIQSALGFVRCEDRAGRACWRSSGSFGALARVRWAIPCDVATKVWPRRLIVSEFLTISSASVQRVHATLGIRGAPGGAGGGMVLPRSADRMGSGSGSFGARLEGGRRCGVAAGPRVRSAVSRTSARACASAPSAPCLRGLRPARFGAVAATRFGTGNTDRDHGAGRLPGRVGERDTNPLRPGNPALHMAGFLAGWGGGWRMLEEVPTAWSGAAVF